MTGRFTGVLVLLTAVLVIAGCESAGGPASPAALKLPPVQHDLGPRAYRAVIGESLGLLNRYWTETLRDEGADPKPPSQLVSYWTRRQDKGCGGWPAGWANAQYCSRNQTISWDGNWLYGTLYRQVGDAAVAFLLAHEYGHLVQDQIGVENRFRVTIEGELNADCLAGAWFGAVDDRVARLTDADYEALYVGVLEVADARGVPWQDPSAHGTAAQRGHALLFGARHGPRACMKELGPGFTS